MEDKLLHCGDCGSQFMFTAGEQQLYQERGMTDPERCKDCRRARRDEASEILKEGEGGGVGGPFNT